jgi:hypothetical protein
MFSSMNHWILHPRPARCPLQHHPTVLSRCIKRCCCPIMGVMIIMDNHGWYDHPQIPKLFGSITVNSVTPK